MSRTRILLVSALITALGVELIVTGRPQQKAVRIHVVDDPRPVAEAASQVEQVFAVPVTYEDTRYVHPDDVLDITPQIRSDPTITARVFARRPGSLNLTYTPRWGAIEAQVGQVLQALVTRANAEGRFGEFRVEWARGGYHVVPVAIKGKTGVMEPYESPLETRITLPYREENGYELVARLTEAITARSSISVHPGTVPNNLMAQSRVSVDAYNDRARDVLWRALRSFRLPVSWHLLCGVGEHGQCVLNIHIARWNPALGQA